MERNVVRVWVDASLGKRVIGLGTVLQHEDQTGRTIRQYGTYIKPGLTTTEAEIFALFQGVDLARLLGPFRDRRKIIGPKERARVIFYTDSEAALKAIYSLGKFRSKATKALVKNLLDALDALIPDIQEWSLQPVKSKDNPADRVAKEARRKWAMRWKPKERCESSGPSFQIK